MTVEDLWREEEVGGKIQKKNKKKRHVKMKEDERGGGASGFIN